MLIISPELFYGCNIGNGEEAVFEVAFSLDEVLIPEFERDFEGQMFLSLLHNIQLINAGLNSHIQLIIDCMHNQPQRVRKPFLDKFEGKKNAISKEGLLHLLENQIQAYSQRAEKQKVRVKGPLNKLNPIPQKQQKKESLPVRGPQSEKKSSGRSRSKQAQVHSQFLQERYARHEQLNELKSQQFLNKVKLPAISKSSSLSSQPKKREPILNAEIGGTGDIASGSHRLRSLPRKLDQEIILASNLPRKMELDSYALRHLQFLDKFEQQLLQNAEGVPRKAVKLQSH